MRRPSHRLAIGGTLLVLLAVSTANAQDSTRRTITRPTTPTYQRASNTVVTRLCNVYSSGAMYCRNIDDLHANEWAELDRTQLQEMFRKVYEVNGFDLRHNGLMSCGSDIPAAAPQSLGALPTATDAKSAIDACLKQFGVAMGRGRGKEGAFGGAPPVPGRSGGWTVTGSCKVPGDPRLAQDAGTDVVIVQAIPIEPDPAPVPDEDIAPLVKEGSSAYHELMRKEAVESAEFFERNAANTTDAKNREKYKEAAHTMWEEARKEEALRELAKLQEDREEKEKQGQGNMEGGSQERTGGGTSACDEAVQRFMAQMAECSRTGGTGYFCEKMKSCSEPMVTNPNPGGPAINAAAREAERPDPPQPVGGGGGGKPGEPLKNEGVRCGEVEVFSEDQLRGALLKHCESKVRYGPDGSSPCTRPGGKLYDTPRLVKNLCNNPVAIVTDDCLAQQGGEVTFPTLRKNFQEVINEVRAKAGGPLIVLPARGPGAGPRPQGPRNTAAPGAAMPGMPGQPAPKPGQPPPGKPSGPPKP